VLNWVNGVTNTAGLEDDASSAGARLAANQAAGNAARDVIARQYPGAVTERTFVTDLGTRRVDILTSQQIAIESKLGYTSLTQSTGQQIARDVALLQSGRVSAVEWVFTRSATTGLAGPSSPLQEALLKAGIPWSVIG
jgi:hypothetical protein